jgi:hypothetical protein
LYFARSEVNLSVDAISGAAGGVVDSLTSLGPFIVFSAFFKARATARSQWERASLDRPSLLEARKALFQVELSSYRSAEAIDALVASKAG